MAAGKLADLKEEYKNQEGVIKASEAALSELQTTQAVKMALKQAVHAPDDSDGTDTLTNMARHPSKSNLTLTLNPTLTLTLILNLTRRLSKVSKEKIDSALEEKKEATPCMTPYS